MPNKYIIRDGDSITSIAKKFGLFEESIWMHADNTELRKKRHNKNILAPGDMVVIPEKEIHQETCATEEKHKFRRKGIPAIIRVQLFELGKPRVNQSYRFDIEGKIQEGKTDGDGILKETVPPSANKGLLIIGPDEEHIEFLFGTLNPADTIRGVAQRLTNLGIYNGDLDVPADNATITTAIKAFQKKYELTITGQIDDATTNKLISVHDVK